MGVVLKFKKNRRKVRDLGVDAPILTLSQDVVPATQQGLSEDAIWAHAEQLYEQGYGHEEVGNIEAALVAYRAAIALKPLFANAHVNAGRLEHLAGNLEAALDHYTAAIAGAAHHPTAMFNLGVVLEDMGHFDRARGAYQSAIKLDPSNADAHYNFARLLEANGDDQGAVRHLNEYRKLRGAR